jgi:hypothetical protein
MFSFRSLLIFSLIFLGVGSAAPNVSAFSDAESPDRALHSAADTGRPEEQASCYAEYVSGWIYPGWRCPVTGEGMYTNPESCNRDCH